MDCLYTTTFFIHNENLSAKLEKRLPRPIMAYSNDVTQYNEQFGLVNPSNVETTQEEARYGAPKVDTPTSMKLKNS